MSPSYIVPSSLQPAFAAITEQETTSYKAHKNSEVPYLVIDDDTLTGIPLKHWHDRRYVYSDYPIISYQVVGGLNQTELTELFKKATIFLDPHVPGFERCIQEASLYGAIPIINSKHNALNREDFPIPRELIVDMSDHEALDKIIHRVLQNYDNYFELLLPFRIKIRGLKSHHEVSTENLFVSTSFAKFIDMSEVKFRDQWKIFPYLASLYYHNPLISTTLLVADERDFYMSHAVLLEDFIWHGLISKSPMNGSTSSFIRFRERKPQTQQAVCDFDRYSDVYINPMEKNLNTSYGMLLIDNFYKMYMLASEHSTTGDGMYVSHGEYVILSKQKQHYPSSFCLPGLINTKKIIHLFKQHTAEMVLIIAILLPGYEENMVFAIREKDFECVQKVALTSNHGCEDDDEETDNSRRPARNRHLCAPCAPIQLTTLQDEEFFSSLSCSARTGTAQQEDSYLEATFPQLYSRNEKGKLTSSLIWRNLEHHLDTIHYVDDDTHKQVISEYV
jgi:hypothetical protein